MQSISSFNLRIKLFFDSMLFPSTINALSINGGRVSWVMTEWSRIGVGILLVSYLMIFRHPQNLSLSDIFFSNNQLLPLASTERWPCMVLPALIWCLCLRHLQEFVLLRAHHYLLFCEKICMKALSHMHLSSARDNLSNK